MERIILLFILFFSFLPTAQSDFSYDDYRKVLKKFVIKNTTTRVDYSGLRKDREFLDSFTARASEVKESEYLSWSEKSRLAFLINAYNAFTLKLIIDNDPVKSIRDLGGLFSSPWKKNFFSLFGEKRSLDWVEHERIRKDFNEPRIHFAVNCASIGCPPLRNEPYVAGKLELQLESAAVAFLSDKQQNYSDGKVLYLSKIFEWYGDDFRKEGSSLENFVAQRMPLSLELKKSLRAGQLEIQYLDYDWHLNGK